jgi:protein TonB
MSIAPPQMEIPRRGETPRDRYIATAFSFIFHGALIAFLLWVGLPEVSELLAGELGGGGGGDGGDQISLISLAGPPEQVAVEPIPVPPPEPEVVPDPTPTPVPPPPKDTVRTPPAPAPAAATPVANAGTATGGTSDGTGAGSAGSGGGAGGGSGGGVGTGTGSGTGSGTGDGTGGGGTSPDGVIPPSPTALHLGPQAPTELRGKSVIVLLTIDTAGKVMDARLEASTGNSKYDAALRKSALGWRFRPARDRNGNAVKGTFAVTYAI